MVATPPDMLTFAYATSYLDAAKCLSKEEIGDNHALLVPFYALIGFAIENALKSVLECRDVKPRSEWFHSHGLSALRDLAVAHACPAAITTTEQILTSAFLAIGGPMRVDVLREDSVNQPSVPPSYGSDPSNPTER